MKAHVETFGCTMNQGEGMMLQERLASLGHEIVGSADLADLVVVNTCAVIRTTENKVLRRILELRRKGKWVVTTGCMAVVQGERILQHDPDALIVPIQDYQRFSSIILERFGEGSGATSLDHPSRSSILPIAQGCLGSCTYCITRLARGRLQSFPLQELLDSARGMVDSGSRELLVTSQDTSAYGIDLGVRLPNLVSALRSIPGEYRIRIGMMNPDTLRTILPEYLDLWIDEKVYKFVHLPVQSGSDRVIDRMGRRYTVAEFEGMVQSFRDIEPDMTLSTDIIVGFPGETQEDHEASMRLLKRLRPNVVNITRFSPRPGTPAAAFEDRVPGWVAKERSRELTQLRFRLAEEINSSFVGREMKALVIERGKQGSMIARTDCYKPVVLEGKVEMGDFVHVVIEDSAATHLYGSLTT